jgi:hypothetical protein
MTHSMVYGVSGDNYNDLGALIRAGLIDFDFLIHGGGNAPNAQFPKDCRAVGGSPCLNNGNDGVPGWDGSANYYKNVANLGYMAAGGESEQGNEIDAIMDNVIFLDYGGMGTGGGTNDNVWYITHPAPVHGHGAASYLETYGSSADFWDWSVVGQGALNAKSHGVKEVGILVGNWMMASEHKTTAEYLKALKARSSAQDYINLANAYEAHGVTCAGIRVWGGYGTSMNGLYNQFSSWFKAWQAIWPANMTPMDKRYGATPPTPTPPTPVTHGDALSYGIHAVDPAAKTVTFVGQTFLGNKLVANNGVNFRRASSKGGTTTYVGTAVSNSGAIYEAKMPLVTGANYFWIVLDNGKGGHWTTDVIWV